MTYKEISNVIDSIKGFKKWENNIWNVLHVVESAAVSPDEFAVFVDVSVQQKSVWNSSHYKQMIT